jgi:putative transposase
MIVEEGDVLVGDEYQIPDMLWNRIKVLLPPPKPKKKSGRPRMDDRLAMNAIFYVLRTGCQWNAIPRSLGASSTVHDRFQEWRKAGVFQRLWRMGLIEYNAEKGLDWEWQVMDGTITKAPLGGKKYRSKPNRQAKVWNETKPASRGKRYTCRTRRRRCE